MTEDLSRHRENFRLWLEQDKQNVGAAENIRQVRKYPLPRRLVVHPAVQVENKARGWSARTSRPESGVPVPTMTIRLRNSGMATRSLHKSLRSATD
jgi:hypothetical protein